MNDVFSKNKQKANLSYVGTWLSQFDNTPTAKKSKLMGQPLPAKNQKY
jgi:hypothetical protein